MRQEQWSASMICANLVNLQSDLAILEQLAMDYLHIDVMDGLFVPRLGMYPEQVQKIKELSTIPIEVHLMIQDPEKYITTFVQAGADIVTVHLEACRSNLVRTIEVIINAGSKVGIALNPATHFDELEYVCDRIDYILIMGINPGIVSQAIKPFIFKKIRKVRKELVEFNSSAEIIVDGGVNFSNCKDLFEAGANILVGGSQTIFHNGNNLLENLNKLRGLANNL